MEKIFFFLIYILFHFFFVRKNISIANAFNLFDNYKNSRKIKKISVPLTGGILIFLSLIISLFLHQYSFFNFSYKFYTFDFLIYFFFIFSIFLLGFLDDKYNLNPNIKLIFSILFFYFILFFDNDLSFVYLYFDFMNLKLNILSFSKIFIIFSLVVFLNAMNMYDGINLQVISYFIFLSIYILIITGLDTFIINILISFLFFAYLNYKNKSYLGDSGVFLLSSIFGIILIKLHNQNLLKCDQILLLLLLPGIDLIRLFVTRIVNKRNPFSADTLHFHHLLLKKFTENQSFLINFIFLTVPNVLGIVFKSYLVFIFFTIVIYTLIFNYLTKNEKLKN